MITHSKPFSTPTNLKRIRSTIAEKSYVSDSHLPIRTERMLSLTRKLETTTTTNESEALLLEANLIKKHKPRFNILLRDDKSFPYILLATKINGHN